MSSWKDSNNNTVKNQYLYSDNTKDNSIINLNKILDISKKTLFECYSSEKTIITYYNNDKIILIQQFYIDKNSKRHQEVTSCLNYNIANKKIDIIYLLNERIYTYEELGIVEKNKEKFSKIIQIVIDKRLSYSDVFKFVKENIENCYVILSNSDIFFDNDIDIIKKTDLHCKKKMYSLLRYDFYPHILTYDLNTDINSSRKCINYRPDSQDSWIWHSNQNLEEFSKIDFNLGIPGCDHKIIFFLSYYFGYKIHNEPELIKTYHYHTSNIRNYKPCKEKDRQYVYIMPPNIHNFEYNILKENQKLIKYIKYNLSISKKFCIPFLRTDTNFNFFRNSKIYFNYEPWIFNKIEKEEYKKKQEILSKNRLNCIWCRATNIYLFEDSWPKYVTNKKILIVSKYVEKIEQNIINLQNIYPGFFINCSFTFIKVPHSYMEKRDLNILKNKVFEQRNNFNILICNLNESGNFLVNYVYTLNKSGICVDFLEIYFGLFKKYDQKYSKYFNKYWIQI